MTYKYLVTGTGWIHTAPYVKVKIPFTLEVESEGYSVMKEKVREKLKKKASSLKLNKYDRIEIHFNDIILKSTKGDENESADL